MDIVSATKLWKKYRYALLIAAVGVLLMLIPGRQSAASQQAAGSSRGEEPFSLDRTEEKMESILSQIEGAGKLKIMLTLASASQLQLAADADRSMTASADGSSRIRQEIVKVNTGSGTQEVIVVGEVCPVYQGALVVCQGADDSSVRLAITEAVSALTGLGSDRISIVKWKKS